MWLIFSFGQESEGIYKTPRPPETGSQKGTSKNCLFGFVSIKNKPFLVPWCDASQSPKGTHRGGG